MLKTLFDKRLCNISLAWKSPFLLALWFTIRNFRYIFKLKRRKSKIIVYIERPILDYEIENLSRLSGIIYIPLPARPCKEIFLKFLGNGHGITDLNYPVRIQDFPRQQQELYDFWKRFITLIKCVGLTDGVMSSNFTYTLHIELNRACLDLKTPFIVLFRESITADGQLQYVADNKKSRLRFDGTKILFFNEFFKV